MAATALESPQVLKFSGASGRSLEADFWTAGGGSSRGLVVVTHGFKAFRRYSFLPELSRRLSLSGFDVLNMDFSHNGYSCEEQAFSDREAFRSNTLLKEEGDLSAVLDHVTNRRDILGNYEQIGLIGHSRGGVAVVQVASKFACVKAICTLGALSDLALTQFGLTPELRSIWIERGEILVESKLSSTPLPIGIDLLRDVESNPRRIERSVQHLNIPYLIVHGDCDERVTVENARQLAGWARQGTLEIVQGGDHHFGVSYPFAGSTAAFEKAVAPIQKFFLQYLPE